MKHLRMDGWKILSPQLFMGYTSLRKTVRFVNFKIIVQKNIKVCTHRHISNRKMTKNMGEAIMRNFIVYLEIFISLFVL